MQRNALSHALWRTLGGVFGVAVLISMAIALSRLVAVAGISLA
jgi:uncharacterized membrane protein YdcZ (DUF606 family)